MFSEKNKISVNPTTNAKYEPLENVRYRFNIDINKKAELNLLLKKYFLKSPEVDKL